MKQEAEKYLKFKNDGTYFQQLNEMDKKEETKNGDDEGEGSGDESDVEPEPEKRLKVEGKDSVSKAENEEKIEKGNNENSEKDLEKNDANEK